MENTLTIVEILVAISAVGISVYTYYHANNIERRINQQADIRAEFDSWISAPIEHHISAFSSAVEKITASARRYSADCASRSPAIADIQNNEFLSAVEEFASFCNSRNDKVLKDIRSILDDFVDALFEKVNLLHEDITSDDVKKTVRSIIDDKQAAISKIQSEVRSHRIGLNANLMDG